MTAAMTAELPHPSIDAQAFRSAMRRPASAVAIVTGGLPGDRAGVTVTAVCSLSDTPPMVLACVHRDSSALPILRAGGVFCVNFLSAAQTDVAGLFAGRGGLKGEDRFSAVDWVQRVSGAPVLAGALASFDCVLEQEIDSATHAILVGRVVAIDAGTDPAPLVYNDGAFGGVVPI
ncbi:flavin reductase family protein [Pseudooceanicola nanhaiensis]|uniref:flavin reductase family protein n=1 Tax=Pseudooceanicola nanhaiensis TaxID=375761 RepID=UPI001CD3E5A4|nr:flavin reductase family protein [Pseudooceanicola nanhaiensis]MCA0921293.1 flavin reductase family protein [Pseudooceanicola nanhaiensis]